MSPRHWRDRVEDIIAAMEDIQRLAAGRDAAALESDATVYKAILYNFVVVGEASRTMPPEICERHPHVAWKGMRSMRNFIAHVYFGVDANKVHETISRDIPVAVTALRQILESEPQD